MRPGHAVARLRAERARLAALAAEGGAAHMLRARAREALHVSRVNDAGHDHLVNEVARLSAQAAAAPPVPAPAPPATEDRLARDIIALQAWFAQAPPADTLISVVLATRNRVAQLERAVASVQAQTHERWELLIVDDASTDATPALLASFDDARVRVLSGSGDGASPARNVALAAATGEVVAYLDDDNLMHPQWLRAVAWAFTEHPDADVLYGARVREAAWETFPSLQLEEWDPTRIWRENLADLNTLAHRAGLPEACFADDLRYGGDWELLQRLTVDTPPLRLPAIACLYTTSAPDRLSAQPEAAADYSRIQARGLRRRPLRILGYNWMFPLITETYIGEELRSLVPFGAELAWYRAETPTAPMRVPEPLFHDIDEALRTFDPDVLFLHWAGYAESQLPELERIGLPFGVRMHGFDLHPDVVARLQAHPQCIGVWTYPVDAFDQLGDHALSTLLAAERAPQPSGQRDLVLSASAGLPKKDFPLLVDALAPLTEVERRIVIGTTNGHTDVPGQIAELCEQHVDPPLLQVNLTRSDVDALMARTSVFVYTLLPEIRFGMPMSIIEALCAGAAVVLPDRPECRAYAGPHARTYRTAEDIRGHIREVLAGGPAIEAEREANMAYARRRFCDPELGRRFYGQLLEGLDRARAARAGWSASSIT